MSVKSQKFKNPFRPGAGHMPPYLAGREDEKKEFIKLLEQDVILQNLILTGLRGVGKTVLLETFKPLAQAAGWLWVGNDMSESTSISEENLALRLVTDLALVTSSISIIHDEPQDFVLTNDPKPTEKPLDFSALQGIYEATPGLISDKLKNVFESVWSCLKETEKRGVVFAYDEAQNLADHKDKNEYPLSLLLEVFQSIQRKQIPFMLALTGLPTLFPKLVETRTYAERMFHLLSIDKLDLKSSEDAIVKPTRTKECPVKFNKGSIDLVIRMSDGYPFFIQYFCREAYDIWIQGINSNARPQSIPTDPILRKLDADFFAGRWARATDRQRDLLRIIAELPTAESEFTVQEVVESSKKMEKSFTSSHANQMLSQLADAGLVYKNRHGKYSLAVPLLAQYIKRQASKQTQIKIW